MTVKPGQRVTWRGTHPWKEATVVAVIGERVTIRVDGDGSTLERQRVVMEPDISWAPQDDEEASRALAYQQEQEDDAADR